MKWLDLITGIPDKIGEYFIRKQEIKAQDRQQERALKQAIHERQIDLIKQGLHADMQWELEMAKQAASSWKDEYVLLLVSIPAVMCFIPGLDIYVHRGFEAIAKMPGWYQITFVSVLLATYGIRWWRRSQYDTP